MTVEIGLTLTVLVALGVTLALTRIATDAVMMAALTILVAAPVPAQEGWRIGVISLENAFHGGAQPAVLTVGVLFVVVCGLQKTGGVERVFGGLFGRPKGVRGALCRMLWPVGLLSAFVNNTPVVAMMIPTVMDWTKRLGIAPSKLLIPLSYVSLLGGSCTLIGTSTNLVVAGLVMSTPDLSPLTMFSLAPIGVISAATGLLFLLTFGPKLLPDRGPHRNLIANPREYTLELMVEARSPMIGRSIEEANLRHLPGCFLAQIERGGEVIPAVSPQHVLREGERLLFVGILDAMRDLRNIRGLTPATDQIFKLDAPRYQRSLFEAVVSTTNPLLGKSVRVGKFRGRYRGVIIAIARDGRRVDTKIGDAELCAGDTLLIESDPWFADRYRDSRDFVLIRNLEDSAPRRHTDSLTAVVIFMAMVVVSAMGWLNLLTAAMLASGLMIASRCCTISEARRSVDWSVLVVIVAALGIGRATELSGTAQWMTSIMLQFAGESPWLALVSIYLATTLITEIATNNAAVAVVFPVAMTTAHQLGVNPTPFVMALAMAGSASFATPLSYQTNLMVYAQGGYRFVDFLRIGIPMKLMVGTVAIIAAPILFPF